LFTSSEFIAPKPLPLEYPSRVLGWKERGGATAVIGAVTMPRCGCKYAF